MVERRTPNQEVLVSIPTMVTVEDINSVEYWLKPRKRRLRPDMTGQLLTGMLNLNTTNTGTSPKLS